MNGFAEDIAGYWIAKDPSATLDYVLDWSTWLIPGETISAAVWTIPAGITKTSEVTVPTGTIAWLSGGIAGQTYMITCRITTTAGRVDERSFRVKVKQR